MKDIDKILRLLNETDLYDAAARLIKFIGEDVFIAAANGDQDALNEFGHKLIESSKNIKNGPVKVKDKQFLKNLDKLRDR